MTTAAPPIGGQVRAAELNVLVRKQRSLWQDAWIRLVRNRAAMTGLAVIVLASVVALFADRISPYDPLAVDTKSSMREPLWGGDPQLIDPAHPLGTDWIGRDLLSRLIYGARISIVIGFVPALVVFSIGVTVGLVAGYRGGKTDNLLMRFTDVIYAFPDLLFLLVIMASLRETPFGRLLGGLLLMFVGIAVVNWVGIARLTRGQVLSLKEREFIEAARCVGASPFRIMWRHLLPNALAPLIVATAFAIPQYVLFEAGLSFLGVGIQPPTPTWGVMIHEGFSVFSTSPWPTLLPAVCISILMLSFTFLGDGLRDALDPRMKL